LEAIILSINYALCSHLSVVYCEIESEQSNPKESIIMTHEH